MPEKKFHDGKGFRSIEEFEATRDLEHTIKLDDGQRQMILKAMAMLSLKYPGWHRALSDIALLMDNERQDGKPEMFYEFRKFNSGPIQLDWVWSDENQEFVATVPAVNYAGTGTFDIHAIKRPESCVRGQWHVLVEPNGVAGLDGQEGFPRYYFKLENLQEEMEAWVNKRQCCLNAISKRENSNPEKPV